MNIGFVTSSVSSSAGGILPSMAGLTQALQEIGVRPFVCGLNDGKDAPDWGEVPVRRLPFVGPSGFGYSPEMRRALIASDADVLHTHGLWMYPSVAVHSWSQETNKPYLVSPHGMLDPWALRHSGMKKFVAGLLYEKTHLRSARCVHALCEAEAKAIRRYGIRSPICVIPNGVDLPELGEPEARSGHRTMLYLGRIHPKKGLANLVKAWSCVSVSVRKPWKLILAGWDQLDHQEDLKDSVQRLGLAAEVDFPGPIFGVDKKKYLQSCDAFVLPSLSEGLPMSVLEAWSYGKPVVMTPECNLPEGFAASAAIRVETQVESIAKGLQTIMEMTGDGRLEMGQRGRRLVEEQFSWPIVAARMKLVYEWLTGRGKRPVDIMD